jgi:hypothetical protein
MTTARENDGRRVRMTAVGKNDDGGEERPLPAIPGVTADLNPILTH